MEEDNLPQKLRVCPCLSSSGETVTSVVSLSPALPKKVRKYKKNKSVEQPDVPPEIPAKGRVKLLTSTCH